MTTIAKLAHDRSVARALRAPANRPAFYCQIATSYSGTGRLLQWAQPPLSSLTFPEWRLLGRFACYRTGSDAALAQPEVCIPIETARRLVEAFSSGVIDPADVMALRFAIAEAA